MTDEQFKELIDVLRGSTWSRLWPILLTFALGLCASGITSYLSKKIRKCNERKELPNKIKTIIKISEEVKDIMSKDIDLHNTTIVLGSDADSLADGVLNDIEIIDLEFNKVYEYLISNRNTLRATLMIKRQINILKKVVPSVLLDPQKVHGIQDSDKKFITNSLELLQESLYKTYDTLTNN
ncbi:hypothetical protein EF384_01075 [Aerococcus agrisoli]|uniref:Uncharacterized protein n=1 Tax=Aerococcus agrisoli TaxID=2487350 RepID=A0A3N4GQ46_9LACT|nr:hypothetical protein [Aerococcus agrisoli]RPA65033.1 hypothetical protein EF384_01075 [Aerococcus agrisoli]